MSLEQLALKPMAQFMADYQRIERAKNPIRRCLVKPRPKPVEAPPPPVIGDKMGAILAVVSEASRISIDEILGPKRDRYCSHPRFVAMWLASELTRLSSTGIGLRFNRDHSSVCHALDRVNANPEEFEPVLSRAKAKLGIKQGL